MSKGKNRSAQGKRYEKEVKDILEAQGWAVEQAINKTVWLGPGRIISVSHDFWNVWDLIAIKHGVIRFIQVTVWEEISHKIKKIRESSVHWEHFSCHIWGRMRGSRQVHYRVIDGGNRYIWTGNIEMVLRHTK